MILFNIGETPEGNNGVHRINNSRFLKEEDKAIKDVNLNNDRETLSNQIIKSIDKGLNKRKHLYKGGSDKKKVIQNIIKQ